MEAQQQFDKIEAYLAGELTGTALVSFEQQIKTDTALAEAISFHRVAQDAIEVLIENDLRKELDLLRAEETTTESSQTKVVQLPKKETATATMRSTQQPAKRRSLFPRLAAAASVILLIGFFTLQNNTSGSILDDHYNEGFTMVEPNRNGDVAEINPLEEGMNDYRTGAYTAAIDFFKAVPSNNDRYNEAQFYLGHSYHKNKAYAKASATFQKLAASGDLRYLDQAEWYQLMALLANKQLEDGTTKTLLNKMLGDKKHTYHQKAQKLKADL